MNTLKGLEQTMRFILMNKHLTDVFCTPLDIIGDKVHIKTKSIEILSSYWPSKPKEDFPNKTYSIDLFGSVTDEDENVCLYSNKYNREPFSKGLHLLLALLQKIQTNLFHKLELENFEKNQLGKPIKFNCSGAYKSTFNLYELSLVWKENTYISSINDSGTVLAKTLAPGDVVYINDSFHKIESIG